MYLPDADKTAFMTNGLTYYYQIMSFSIKTTGATYQRLMDKVSVDHIGCNLEVYVDDMVIKSTNPKEHIKDLEEMKRGKFLGFMLAHRGIRYHQDEKSPKRKIGAEVNRAVSFTVSLPVEKTRLFFQLLKKSTSFHWDDDYERAFQDFKQFLVSPPVLTKPVDS
ncbi:Tf2-9, partial [Mucuna pruriens]